MRRTCLTSLSVILAFLAHGMSAQAIAGSLPLDSVPVNPAADWSDAGPAPNVSGCTPQQITTIVPTSFSQVQMNFTVTAGAAVTLSLLVQDDCGNNVSSASTYQGQVTAWVGNNGLVVQTIQMADTGNGVWQGPWIPGSASASVEIGVSALAQPASTVIIGELKLTGVIAPPATPPMLSVDTQSISLTAMQGGANVSQQIQVSDTGGGSVAFTAAASSQPGSWLTVSTTSGSAAPASPTAIIATASPGALAAGTYSGNVTISGAGSTITIPLTLSVSAPPAVIQLSQTGLSFAVVAQGSTPSPQAFGIVNGSQGSMSWTASAATASGGNWLQILPSSGTAPANSQVAVSINPAGVAAGTYQGSVSINAPQATNTPQLVTIHLTVQAPPPQAAPAALAVDTQSVSLTAAPGSGATGQQVHILDTGGGSVSFTAAAASSGNWLSVSPSSGSATLSSPAAITITAAPGALPAGSYSGTVTVTGAGSTVGIPVTLSVSAPPAVILLSQTGLSFTGVAQGGALLPQTFGILNTGQGSMNWTATASTASGGNWLQVSPSSGTGLQQSASASSVSASVALTGLAAGAYSGQISVASPQATNSPQLITVILTVLSAGSALGPQVYPSGLVFTGAAGVNPGSQAVTIANRAGDTNSYQSGIVGSGFSFLPTSAALPANQTTTLTVYPDFSKLSPASISQGTITLQFADRSPSQTINVLTVVSPSGSTSQCASQALQIQYKTLQQNFTATVGQGTALEVQVTDGCGNLVGPGGQNAQVTAFFSSGDTVSMTHIGNGIWQGTWRPVTAGTFVARVTAVLQQAGSVVGGTSASLTCVVNSPASASTAVTPAITAQGVVQAASFIGGAPIAPGELITVFGQNLASGVTQSANLPWPQQAGGATVFLGSQPLPILYASTGQLNLQVPYPVPVNTQYQLSVQNGSTLSVPLTLVVASAAPGIFAVNSQGTGQGSIVKSDGVTLAQAGTPALIGETIVIYCTGLGAVTGNVAAGTAAPSSPPATTVNPVAVTIGGQPAAVVFSGLTPGFAGLYQVNAVVPSGVTAGNSVPVTVSAAGQTSPAVTIAVAVNAQTPIPPAIGVDTQKISLAATQGEAAVSQQIHVLDTGGGSVSFTATAASTGSWLSVSPASGSATSSSSALVTVTASPGALAAGTYSGTVTITGAGSTVTIAATFSVSPPPAVILLSQTGLSFAAVAQGGVVLPQTFGILNSGQGSMNWTAVTSTVSGGSWLQISPSSGTALSLVGASINPAGLAAGTYRGSISVSSPLATNSPQALPVVLTVLPAGSALAPQVYPAGLLFAGASGQNPATQTVAIANRAGDTNSYESGIIGSGFSFSPTNAALPASQATTLSVYPNFSTLAQGSVNAGSITLQFADQSPSQTIHVLTVVSPSGSTAQCAVQPLQILYRSLQSNFTATVGQPTTIEVQVSDGCGNSIGPTGQNAQVTSYVSDGASVTMAHIGGGIWQGTWQPASAGAFTLKTTAVAAESGALVGGTSAALSGSVAQAAPAACASQPLVVVFRSPQAGFAVMLGQATTVSVLVSDGCGNLVGTSGQPQVTAFFSNGAPQVSMTNIGAGIWQATWTPTGIGAISLEVTAILEEGGTIVGGTATLTGSVIQ
jgi:uncharacterized protein (TIGR03437 family)